MNHGSLFSGIGGFDLAAEWMGWENKFHCEWNEFGQQILNYYWPKAKSYGDITATDFTIWNGKIDILTGGFPCQPYSQAGKRRGKEDERHLWPEMLRAIKEIEPRWIVGENVYGIVNWNDGVVFEEVQTELEDEGYKVQPYILPAVSVNAPHRRDRVWFVAYSNQTGLQEARAKQQTAGIKQYGKLGGNATNSNNNGLHDKPATENKRERKDNIEQWGGRFSPIERFSNECNATNPADNRLQGRSDKRKLYRKREGAQKRSKDMGKFPGRQWQDFPTQPPVCRRDDGLSEELDSYTFPKWRSESIKAYGNAIVPQVALQIFKAIEAYEDS